jgi:type II secretory pathway pseudopilin PulG
MTGRREPASRESGFAMLLVFLMAAFIAISLYIQIPRIAFQAQRQKEQLLIERGEQYKRAIQLFVRANGRYPGKIEDLENFNNRRFLRHRFVDPMTGKTEWRLIHINGGVFTDSIVNKAKQVGQQSGATANTFVGEQAYVGNDTTPGTPGVPGGARRRQSEGGPVPLGPDGQPLAGVNGQLPGDVTGGAPFNGQLPGGDPKANLNGQPGGQQPAQQFGTEQFNPAVPGAPGQPPSGIIPGFPPGVGNNPGAQPDGRGNPNFFQGRFQPRQVVNQPGTTPPDGQPGGIQQPGSQPPGFPQPGVQPGGTQQPGFPQNGTPFGGQPGVNNPAAVGTSSFVGASQSFVGSSQSFVGGGGSVGSQPNGGNPVPGNANPGAFPTNSFPPTNPQNPAFGQNPVFGQPAGFVQQPGLGQQPGQASGNFNNQPNVNNQPNFPQGAGTPYAQPNPATSAAAANLINGILTNPQGQPAQTGNPGNPAPRPVGQQIGGGVAGVASTAEAPSIMVYNERTKYNEWEFIFDLSKQRGLMNPNMPIGQNINAPLAVGTGAPSMAVSAPPSAAVAQPGTQVALQPTYGGGLNAGGAGPVIPGQQGLPGQGLPGQLQGGLPPGFRLGRP